MRDIKRVRCNTDDTDFTVSKMPVTRVNTGFTNSRGRHEQHRLDTDNTALSHDDSFGDLSAICAAVTTWHAALKTPRPEVFSCAEVSAGIGTSPQNPQLPTAMAILGWHRRKVWDVNDGKRVLRVYYAPPGCKVPQPKRGRPSINLIELLGITF